MSDNKKSINRNLCLAVFVVTSLLMLACEVFKVKIFGNGEYSDSLHSISSRFFGVVLCVVLVLYCGFKDILKFGKSPILKGVLATLPCWVIALNNFPIIPFLLGEAKITSKASVIFLYAVVCFFVGVFEELAYRGCVFMLILKNSRSNVKDIFKSIIISSALFGAVHLVNLFVGANPGGVVLQVGYSFLIGAMCSFVLIKTGSIWHCAILHAVYNFCGGIIANYGEGSIWTASEVALTAIVAVLVAIYVFISLMRLDPKETDKLFGTKQEL